MPECALASSIASRVSFVNLQKFTFQAWLDPRSMKMLAPAQKMRSFRLVTTTACTSGMLEADPLNRVGQLDVDAEVVRVQLEPIVGRQARVLLHVHRERRDGSVERQLPVPVAGRDRSRTTRAPAWRVVVAIDVLDSLPACREASQGTILR